MKVFVQIGSSNEVIYFNLKSSQTIWDVKSKIAKERGILIRIQRIFGKYQDIGEDHEYGLEDKTKLYKIDKNGKIKNCLSSFISKHRRSDGYLFLYLSQLKINVSTCYGFEFSIDVDPGSRLSVSSIKNFIYEAYGFPSAMQKLYLGHDTPKNELWEDEVIRSSITIERICLDGLVLRLTGKVPLRNISRGASTKVEYPVINATDRISKIKKKLSDQNVILYIDGNEIQNLNDNKRLLEYDLRDLLSNGLLMKAEIPPMTVFVELPTRKILTFHCDAEDLVGGLEDKIADKEGIPVPKMRLFFNCKRIGPSSQTLSHFGITHESTIELYLEQCGS